MKRILNLSALTMTLVLSITACRPEKKELGPKANQVDGISTQWILSRVDQIDVNVQLAFVESDTLLNVTDAYIDGAPMEIGFDKAGAYTITPGAGSNLFKNTTGKWSFDNNQYPSYVVFDAASATENNMKLIRPVRPQDNFLVLKYNKICGGKRTVSYHLTFNRK
ncbi:MAG: hypothetical protein RLZZ146_1579 [Bacteroidota bacterium]|jgi:Domain of unknown function (DUF5004)